jgi:muramoyltetrapeptide carboxypeptidase
MVAELTRTPRLQPGDRVAVVAPSGPVPEDRLHTGVRMLREWGLDVALAKHVSDVHPQFGYLAGTDADRAADLQEAWLDDSISGILCARGGYGVQRMVDLLDWDAMRASAPKVFCGYSDVTSLHSAFATKLGVVTFHGPNAGGLPFISDQRSERLLRQMFFEPEAEAARTLTSPTAETLVPGRAHGVTLGGCLALIAADVGTPTGQPSAAGGIVVLEDTGEDRYRLDRYVTQLLRAGWFDGVAGIALGSWYDCEDGVRELMLERLSGLGVPIIWELGFGDAHTNETHKQRGPPPVDGAGANGRDRLAGESHLLRRTPARNRDNSPRKPGGSAISEWKPVGATRPDRVDAPHR